MNYLATNQTCCYDERGAKIPCRQSGQDGEFTVGIQQPGSRFNLNNNIIIDRLTGLQWPVKADTIEFPLTWQECLDSISDLNKSPLYGYKDWHLPNGRELRSLLIVSVLIHRDEIVHQNGIVFGFCDTYFVILVGIQIFKQLFFLMVHLLFFFASPGIEWQGDGQCRHKRHNGTMAKGAIVTFKSFYRFRLSQH